MTWAVTAALLIGGLICIGVPVALAVFIVRREKGLGTAVIAGVLSFFVMQVMIRMPLLANLQSTDWFSRLPLIAAVLILAVTAALFETAGRLFSIGWFVKKNRDMTGGIAHGIGHGGVEAILLVGINYLVYAGLGFIIDEPFFLDFLDQTPELDLLIDQLQNLKVVDIVFGTMERMMTIVVHIGLSVWVMRAFTEKDWTFALAAFVFHMVFDFTIVFIHQTTGTLWLSELIAFLFTAVMAGSLVILKKQSEPKAD